MRVLVVGAGRMAALRAEDLVADPRVDAVSVTNRSAAGARQLAARYGLDVVAHDRLAAAAGAADAVVVACATAAHAEVLDAVLPTGRPVLCEKPLALTLADTVRLADLAARSGSPVQVGFQRRFDPALRAVRERVADGRAGTLYAIRALSHDHRPAEPGFIAPSGGIFRDLLVPDLDLVAWLTGSPVATVHATVAVRHHRQYAVHHRTTAGPVPDGDVALVHAVTASGVPVSIHGARHDALGHDVRVEVLGSADSLSAGLTGRTPLHAVDPVAPGGTTARSGDDGPAPYDGFVDRFREAFRAETAAFVDLAGGGPPRCPAPAAVAALRAAVACEWSVLRGGPVRVDDVVPEADRAVDGSAGPVDTAPDAAPGAAPDLAPPRPAP